MASNASARRGVGSGEKTAFGEDGNGSEGRGTNGNLLTVGSARRPNHGVERRLGRLWWRVGAIDSSGTAVRVEVASFGERPSSGLRAVAVVVEVLLMLGVSLRRIGAAASGESSTDPSVAASLTSDVPDGGDWVAIIGRGPPAGLTAGGRSGGCITRWFLVTFKKKLS
jgi:hypothetical protein